jgi:SAM-dependent methyltransferase
MELSQYPLYPRPELEPLLPPRVDRALDIGCGPGGFGTTLRRHYPAAKLVAVEPEPAQAAQARTRFDEVFEGFFPEALPPGVGSFDLISMNDVIEHMVDPWTTVRQVADYLTPGGQLLAAIPNVRFVTVSANLLFKGEWQYVDEGLLDRTHLRFFTRQTVEQLFDAAGFEIVRMDLVGPMWARGRRYRPLRLVSGRHADLLHSHFAVLARPR